MERRRGERGRRQPVGVSMKGVAATGAARAEGVAAAVAAVAGVRVAVAVAVGVAARVEGRVAVRKNTTHAKTPRRSLAVRATRAAKAMHRSVAR